jgi:hypothetical protein
MAAMVEEEDAGAQALSTSLDPYGQLIKMLMPRALCIGIYDRMGMPLWLSDGCEGPDLLQFIEEALNSARSGDPDPTAPPIYSFCRLARKCWVSSACRAATAAAAPGLSPYCRACSGRRCRS